MSCYPWNIWNLEKHAKAAMSQTDDATAQQRHLYANNEPKQKWQRQKKRQRLRLIAEISFSVYLFQITKYCGLLYVVCKKHNVLNFKNIQTLEIVESHVY